MKVLVLSQEIHPIPPTKGAAVEQWIDAVAHRCERYLPLLVSVPHPCRPDDEVIGNVHYHRIRIGRIYRRLFRKLTRIDPWSYCDRIVAFAQPQAPAIIHLHNAPQFVDALRRGLPNAKLILHMHNEKECHFSATVDALVGCSHYIENWFHAHGTKSDYFGTLPNGVDTARFAPPKEVDRTSLRARLGLPPDRFVVLYAGRISPEKGPDLLADAFAHLDLSHFHCVIAGEWPQGNPAASQRVVFANSLREKIHGLPITLLGSRAPETMPEVYHAADLLVIPSRFEEPFSMAAIEAMACGLPVLALARGGMIEYMRDGENARVLPAQVDAMGLATAIMALAMDASLRAKLAIAGRKLVVERFDWKSVADATESLYDRLLSRRQHE